MKTLSDKEMRTIKGGIREDEPGPRPFNPFDNGVCYVNGYQTQSICLDASDCDYPGQSVECRAPGGR